MRPYRYISVFFLLAVFAVSASAQADRHDVRSGNRKFRKGKWKEAEIEYRKGLVKDSTSVAANYDLASALYRQDNYGEAATALDTISKSVVLTPHAPAAFYNRGDAACKQKDWRAAVDAFKKSLLLNPGDLDAKENYAYAKMMLDNQEGGGGGGGQQNQDQNQDRNQQNQNQDQNQNQQDQDQQDQNQNQDQQNQDQDRNQDSGQDNQENISPQQAQQMLRAIQAREKQTQDKVNREKAEAMKSRQTEKNW